jgi:cysteine desulfurase family protein (TIGR01976 family)
VTTRTTLAPVLDLAAVRSAFPALLRVHEGRPVAYFDGPGGTQVPQVVVDAVADYLLHHNANTHWNYPTSEETDAALLEARRALADFLGGATEEIAFGANMTTLTLHVSRALGRRLGPGDEVVVTELDHHANVDPWRELRKERGVSVRSVPLRPSEGLLDWPALEGLIGPRTRVLAIGAASNALGTINDVKAAADLAHSRGALVFVDAVHYAAHALVDVKEMGCDLLACSAYKFYGPHVGVLWGRRELLEEMEVARLLPAPDSAPERIETGTQNHEGIVGAAAAVDFLASLAPGRPSRRAALRDAFGALHQRGRELLERLWVGLSDIPGLTLFGVPPESPRTPTLSFVVKDRSSDDVARALAREAVFASNGDFYAATVVKRLGYERDGVVRAGCACYTSAEEVDRLLEAVRRIARA